MTLRGVSVDGGPVDAHALYEAILKQDARNCEYLTAHDPDRGRLSATLPARSEAEAINRAVTAAICPDRSSCSEPRSTTASDVALVREALRRLGYPDADVRPAAYVGESPAHDIVYGVQLHTVRGCLVSFARTGQGAAPMGPVGALSDGRCLHPGPHGVPEKMGVRQSGPIASLDCLRSEESTACDEGG
ncbi:hypothetical protein Aph02nite_84100 [Actinoplanes philippinensis]|nr:hypothetical protein Aph02nite_84100 [Actinoplanes philippinensis]